MRFLFVALSAVFLNTIIYAQDKWKVMVNDKILLSTTIEDEAKNMITIKATDLKKKKDFVVAYTEAIKQNDWERSMMLYDENDRELTQQKGSKLKIKNNTLLSFFKNSKKVSVYTWAFPTDPSLKAAIRVRRVHLCTLVLQ